METIDLMRQHKHLYHATAEVQPVNAEPGVFLAVDGQGAPGGPEFGEAIGRLYTVAYVLKYQRKEAGGPTFKVPKLECLWHLEDATHADPATWRWRVMLRIPAGISAAQVRAAREAAAGRKGQDLSDVERITWDEGTALQVLHVGPYDEVGATYEALNGAAKRLHYDVRGPAHEVYLNDPDRTEPRKLKTVVRLAVSRTH
jgi:hypothetical protein